MNGYWMSQRTSQRSDNKEKQQIIDDHHAKNIEKHPPGESQNNIFEQHIDWSVFCWKTFREVWLVGCTCTCKVPLTQISSHPSFQNMLCILFLILLYFPIANFSYPPAWPLPLSISRIAGGDLFVHLPPKRY